MLKYRLKRWILIDFEREQLKAVDNLTENVISR